MFGRQPVLDNYLKSSPVKEFQEGLLPGATDRLSWKRGMEGGWTCGISTYFGVCEVSIHQERGASLSLRLASDFRLPDYKFDTHVWVGHALESIDRELSKLEPNLEIKLEVRQPLLHISIDNLSVNSQGGKWLGAVIEASFRATPEIMADREIDQTKVEEFIQVVQGMIDEGKPATIKFTTQA